MNNAYTLDGGYASLSNELTVLAIKDLFVGGGNEYSKVANRVVMNYNWCFVVCWDGGSEVD
jgi:hypothetical protein